MHKKLLGTIAIILILIAIPLTVFIAQKQQEIRQKASGEDTTVFLTSDTNIITSISLTPGGQATLALYVDTGANRLNGFDITVNLSNALNLITIQSAEEGKDAQNFNTPIFKDIDKTNGTIRFAKVTTDTSANIFGRLHLGTVNFTVNTSASGQGTVGVTSALLTSPNKTSGLTVALPTLKYIINSSTTPTNTPVPTNTPAPSPTPAPIPGPAGWWKFDETTGTSAADSSGNGLSGTLNGGGSWTSGKIAGGLALTNNQYAEIPNSAASLHSDRQISITGWFKLNNLDPQWTRIFWKGDPDCGTNCDNREYSLWVRNDGLLHLASTPADRIGTGQTVCNSTAGTIQANQWYHFAAVLNSDANSMKSYINGVEKGSCSYSTSNIRTTNGNFQIGNVVNGTVDDYRIYKRALSVGEITDIYNGVATLNFTITLPGIDGIVTTSILKRQRDFQIQLFDATNHELPVISRPISFHHGTPNPVSITYVGNVDLGSVTSGNYTIKVKTNKFLKKLIPGFKNIAPNTTITLPAIALIPGDIDNNNVLNIADYNILMSCFGAKMDSSACGSNKENADLNEDGKVNEVDYNIFLRNIQAKQGD